ncbi:MULTISPECIES: periplasmic nitrate reductase, NapE protein [unclassified Sphingopyxis]|jgi:nitrate reductase NapE|uniref:periplasmic nitrate reductase, NapE protein n=1 Tax=unclassified Sphingopyxis TaxID=2614943 RepID=UPI0010F8C791|nr:MULTISPECIES: periplasmic nitrate reductase, NapE protein [unclassified Sphingopyxis]MBR2171970.1 periplasmic nitrate reductase, NapE protein [Sphingopyxis sp.]
MKQDADTGTRKRELRLFLFMTVVLFPVLAVITVAAYGFLVWMWQLLNGPPGV